MLYHFELYSLIKTIKILYMVRLKRVLLYDMKQDRFKWEILLEVVSVYRSIKRHWNDCVLKGYNSSSTSHVNLFSLGYFLIFSFKWSQWNLHFLGSLYSLFVRLLNSNRQFLLMHVCSYDCTNFFFKYC